MAVCSTCGSVVRLTAGAGIIITGAGTDPDPFVIRSTFTSYAGTLLGDSSSSVTTVVSGSGTEADPFRVRSTVDLSMSELSDVDDPLGPNLGDSPVWNGVAWEFAPPNTTPPGAVGAGPGLAGDGSAGNLLRVAVSDSTTTSLTGAGIYVDSEGKLRANVASSLSWVDVANKPTSFPSTWSDVANKPTSFTPATHVHPGADITSGTVAAARLPKVSALQGITVSTASPSGGADGDLWLVVLPQ